MKKLYLIIIVLLSQQFTFAQKDTVTLKDMEIPTSPGFILLDESASNIERPNSSKAFSLSILNALTEGNGFPKNYAVEFTPFWFFKHKKMNALKYIGFDGEKERYFSSVKMASISAASINSKDTLTGKTLNNISVGARTTLFKIYPKSFKEKLLKANLAEFQNLKGLAETLKREGATDVLRIENPEKYKEIETRILTAVEESKNESSLENVLKTKPLLAVDGAVAYSNFFIDGDFSTRRFGRLGIWTTVNLAINLNKENTQYLNFYAVGRYLSDGLNRDDAGSYFKENSLDFGGKLELELKAFSIGYEFIQRNNDVKNTFRSVGNLRYKISENLYLVGAYGKNFGEGRNLISLLGINWGINSGNEKAKVE
ncbi:hypothetical protein [Epilithonimonas hungarica]|uniref:Uncharacterized protein n=1 Tax=Epilithonimonas hungarica TaxID=454006 RepID=A0A1G7TLN6_9FLAO|nr:hypothetical protein [Epilithonimonas hungarica]SDG36185.1 hypothetical protein SAMN05421825_3155 [Epilithonimonas hungarica]